MSLTRALAVVCLAGALCGCGAIFNGSRQNIFATSSPDGAKVTGAVAQEGYGGAEYTTPATLSLQRKSPHVLVFSKDGYSQARFEVHNSLNVGIVVLDVLFTGFIGVVVDAVTGSWYKLVPQTATVTLQKLAMIDGPERIDVVIRSPSKGKLRIESTTPGVRVHTERGR